MTQSRTNTCGELRLADAGKTVTLAGWLENVREVGANFAFLVLRDYYGTTQVVVETAANNTYDQTLSSKMATSDAPTIFQVNGPRGYANWSRYCAPLGNSKLYRHLNDPELALTAGDEVYGIPYVVEGYGILYNQAIIDGIVRSAKLGREIEIEIPEF